MKVAKFGGSSLADAKQIIKVCQIVLGDRERRLVIVSAPGKRFSDDIKVTDLLIACANDKLEGRNCDHSLRKIVSRFEDITKELLLDEQVIEMVKADLANRLSMPVIPEGKFMDTMKAAGEDITAKIIAQYMKNSGIDAKYVNPKDAGMVLTEEYGNACLLRSSYEALSKLKESREIVIFPGFFGYSENGDIVTFPRGGSDITGSILAAAVKADFYENFTDVDNVFAANPKVIKEPVGIEELTYKEMRELSYAGFSVLHEETLEPVYKAHIPVWIKNTNNPKSKGTMILPTRMIDPKRPVVGIAADSGFVSVYISKYMMNKEIGFGRKVLQILERMLIPYEHIPSGIDNISIILKAKYFTRKKEIEFVSRLKELEIDEVSVQRDLSIVMIVGEGMLHSIGVAGRATSALAKSSVNIRMINQGSSEVSIMFGVLTCESDIAIKSLYNEFFPIDQH